MHFHHDVEAANELSLDVHLRDSRPVRVLFDCGSECLIGQHIYILVLFDTVGIQEGDNSAAEATLGHFPGTFHEQANIILADPFRDVLCHFIGRLRLRFWLEIIVTIFVSSTSSIVGIKPSNGLLPLSRRREEIKRG